MKQHGANKIQPIETGEKAREFYTVSQLAELLQLTEMTIYRMISRGELPCYVIGRAKRFRSRDLESFLESCRMPAGRAIKPDEGKTLHDAVPIAPSQEE